MPPRPPKSQSAPGVRIAAPSETPEGERSRHPLFEALAHLVVPQLADRCGLWEVGDEGAVLRCGDGTAEPPRSPHPARVWLGDESGWVPAPPLESGAEGRAVAVPLGRRGELVVAERGAGREPFHAAQLPWLADLVAIVHRAEEREELSDRLAHARSAADAAAHRGASLARISALLAGATDEEDTLEAILEGVVPYLADWALVDLVPELGEPRRRSRHAVPAQADELARLHAFPFGAEGVVEGIAALPPEGIVVPDLGAARDFAAAPEEELVRRLRPRSFAIVPMSAGERAVAALTLVASEQRYEESDVDLFRQVAGLGGLALTSAAVLAEARAARREREEVLAIVSHDLKNPLHVLSFATSVLGQPGFPQEQVARQVPVIERAVRHMTELIESLLDAARIDAGRFSVERYPHDPSDLVREALERMGPLAEQARIELVDRVPRDLPAVAADRERLLRVFANLLDNGISFTPAGGRVEVSASAKDGFVWFEVCDTGEGIEPEVLERIFDRFWNARRRGKAGSGLGLAIVRGIVDAHGGEIEVESKTGEGTTFRFGIPTAAAGADEGDIS